jgi:hypothetical protein
MLVLRFPAEAHTPSGVSVVIAPACSNRALRKSMALPVPHQIGTEMQHEACLHQAAMDAVGPFFRRESDVRRKSDDEPASLSRQTRFIVRRGMVTCGWR